MNENRNAGSGCDQAKNVVVPPEFPTAVQLANPFREVLIRKVANGFILSIGCQTFVAKTWDEAADGLRDYYKNPREAEKKYCATTGEGGNWGYV
jgi:hypothetical protein